LSSCAVNLSLCYSDCPVSDKLTLEMPDSLQNNVIIIPFTAIPSLNTPSA
jgi:hypothetical protein